MGVALLLAYRMFGAKPLLRLQWAFSVVFDNHSLAPSDDSHIGALRLGLHHVEETQDMAMPVSFPRPT